MKRNLFMLVMSFYTLTALAVPACPDSIQVEQPDGTMLRMRIHGDEFYNWISTTDGHIVLRDSLQYYRYATVVNDSLVPSTMIAQNVENRTASEKQYLQTNTPIVKNFVSAEIQVAYAIAQAEKNIQNDSEDATTSVTQRALSSSTGVHGTRKVLTILMGFSDKPFTKTAAEFNNLMNGSTGSVRKFYQEDSYNNLDISATVVGPYTAILKSTHYTYYGQGDGTLEVRELVREALHRASEHGVDFSDFDGNNDGFVDCVHIVFAGYGRENNPNDGLIWSHKSELASAIIRDGKKAKQYIITPELYTTTSTQIAPIGTICHELGHILGAPDYYDTKKFNGNEYCATGNFDLMGGGSWNGSWIGSDYYSGISPAHNNAYTKCYLFGWGTPEIISAESQTYNLPSSTSSSKFYRVNTSTNGEFFLLENRTQTNFDSSIPNAGLLVYHIHKDLPSAIADNEPINAAHPLKCYIVNAAATTNPTATHASYGTHGTARAFPGSSNSHIFLTSSSTPSLTAWNGSSTGVNICFIRKNGTNIVFTVNPQINGTDQLCNEETYCIGGTVPAAATISWSYSSSINAQTFQPVLNIDNTTSACATVERGFRFVSLLDSGLITPPITPITPLAQPVIAAETTSNSFHSCPYVGEATLFATISNAGESYTLSKTLTLPQNITPSLNTNYMTIWLVGQERSLTEQSCGSLPADQIKWYIRYPQSTEDVILTGRTVNIKPTATGTLTIRIVNDCGCETQNEATYSFTVTQKLIILSYANPTTGSVLNVEITDNTDATTTSSSPMQAAYTQNNEGETYTIELWHGTLGKVRSINTSQKQVSIDVAGLPAGWYQLLLLQDNQIITSGNVLINQ